MSTAGKDLLTAGNTQHMRQLTLFLLAHQDDEFAVYFEIERTLALGGRAICLYLTDGSARTVPRRRNEESLAVLARLGVPSADVHFLGESLNVVDGQLVEHLERAYHALKAFLPNLGPISRLVIHAWEGGHPDHDAAHLLGLTLAQSLGCLESSRQFTSYRAAAGLAPLFALFRPLSANGYVESNRIPVSARLRYVGYSLSYKTQRGTFLALLPLMIFDYMFHGTQKLQPLDRPRALERPHPGKLLYEARSGLAFETFWLRAAEFVRTRVPSHG